MVQDDTVALLERAELFSACDAEQRRLLAFASEMLDFAAESVIYAHGDDANGAYVLSSGTLSVIDDPERPHQAYTVASPGTVVGEMGLLLKKPRRATVKALTRARLLFVPRSAFQKLMRQHPDMAAEFAARIERQLGAYLGALDRFRGR